MAKGTLDFENISIDASFLEDGLLALQVQAPANDFGVRKSYDIIIDTKWDTILTGKMPNMLLHVLKGRRKDFENE